MAPRSFYLLLEAISLLAPPYAESLTSPYLCILEMFYFSTVLVLCSYSGYRLSCRLRFLSTLNTRLWILNRICSYLLFAFPSVIFLKIEEIAQQRHSQKTLCVKAGAKPNLGTDRKSKRKKPDSTQGFSNCVSCWIQGLFHERSKLELLNSVCWHLRGCWLENINHHHHHHILLLLLLLPLLLPSMY